MDSLERWAITPPTYLVGLWLLPPAEHGETWNVGRRRVEKRGATILDRLDRAPGQQNRWCRWRTVALANAIDPLFDEINSVLDQLVATPHPLPDDQAALEDELNSLAQAGMGARMELDDRG
jgi:hypothetical protein